MTPPLPGAAPLPWRRQRLPGTAWTRMTLLLLMLALVEVLVWMGRPGVPIHSVPGYLPLHTTLEIASIVVSMMVFSVAWLVGRKAVPGNVTVAAALFLLVGLFDLQHTLSYVGMPDFITHNDGDKQLQPWMMARMLAALALLLAALRPAPPLARVPERAALLYGLLGAGAVFGALVVWHGNWLPSMFGPDAGLSAFKKNTEYIVIAIHVTTAALLLLSRQRQRQLLPGGAVYLYGAVLTLAMAELYFTEYQSVTGSHNTLGHLYKVLGYLMIYRALVTQAIEAPYEQLAKVQGKLTLALHASNTGLWTWDMASGEVDYSPEWMAQLGYAPGQFAPEPATLQQLLHPDDRTRAAAALQACLAGQAFEAEYRLRHADGSYRWIMARGESQYDAEGQVVRVSGSHVDISARKRDEDALRVTASVFDNSQEGILITDVENRIIDVNAAFERITGYAKAEVLGQNPRLLSSGRQDAAFYRAMWQQLAASGAWRGELWNRRKSGEVYPEHMSLSAVRDANGTVLRYVAVFADISHIKEHEEQLNYAAHFDALTGIPNRVLLADRMQRAIASSAREHTMMAVCYLDLDGFKQVNDRLGHDVGDQVLVEVSRRISATIRGGDTVARLGGDEFVVLLLGLTRREEWISTLERLLEAVAEPVEAGQHRVALSASIGVGIYPVDEQDPDILLRHADHAMYTAKQEGKNCFHIYDSAMDKRAREQIELLKAMRLGLDEGQFELYYQPKVRLDTGALIGVEALLRWHHPSRGLLAPGAFLEAADRTEVDIALGGWVMRTALAQAASWHGAGLPIEVSINISGHHLESTGFVAQLTGELAAWPSLPPDTLQIEVLETVALQDIAHVQDLLRTCSALGVQFALDDFGTGYSSLSYLSSLPFHVLKIDQSFVRDMLEDKGDLAIVHGIIALARAFERRTVAEGIETDAHLQQLHAMGCDIGQGYAIARPMPAAELAGWHARWQARAAVLA